MNTLYTQFTPCYVLPEEFGLFGLPCSGTQPDIMPLVLTASMLIDEACGRIDGDGNGSLVFTTYTSRLLMQVRNRNLVEIPMKPLSSVTPATVADLQALAATGTYNGAPFNPYYAGDLQANTQNNAAGWLSAFVWASGRYGYTRQDQSLAYPDLFAFINPLNLVTMFGGPAPWTPIDITNTDYDRKTGECWVPSGLQLQRYSEIWVQYNSGFDPRYMPRAIKYACVAIVKNLLAKGGTTGQVSFSLARSGANLTMMPEVIDPTIDAMLGPFKNVRSV